MKPRIGLTPTPAVAEGRPVDQLNRAYVEAVVRAGGLPFILPVLDPVDAEPALLSLDGLLLTGGGDVEPDRYGAVPAPEVYGVEPGRDAYELALVAAAARTGMPVLGVCRGAQLLNVALGGTLVQHLPDVTEAPHRVGDRWAEGVHPVEIAPDSLLAAVTGPEAFEVNSLHHQSVDRPGAGLRVVAYAPDGVVEAIEGTGGARLLGVQWHPELLAGSAPHEALFGWLVTEAAGVQAGIPAEAPAADAVA
jgi:putative glutamine amidotransferase